MDLRVFSILMLLLLLPSFAHSREAKYDPISGRVRVLYLGDAIGSVSPAWKIATDPRFVLTPVPAMEMFGILGGAENVQKFQRMYLPRRYGDLVSQQDVIILSDTESMLYTTNHISWFSRSVEEDGNGLLMVGGRQTLLGEWAGTTVEQALPGDFLGLVTLEGFAMKAVPVDPDGEFASSLPLKDMPAFVGLIVFVPKQGSTTILTSRPNDVPILLYHDYGEGGSMILSPDWCGAWTGGALSWEYWADFISNVVHMTAGLKIPQDPALMHALRDHFADYEVSKGMILSLIDFADKFGANTRSILDRWAELSEKRGEADRLYIQQDYSLALEQVQSLEEDVLDIYQLALRVKDQALFWVYMIEVSTVTGTSLVCGAVVWILMVRRKLYKEVSTTRPSRKAWED